METEEHEERSPESEDHERLADELDEQADRLEGENRRLGERIGKVRDDWESKRGDAGVPGAQPRPDGDSEDDRSGTADDDTADDGSDSSDDA